MTWTIRTTPKFLKELGKIDQPVADRILQTLADIAILDNPRTRGRALTGNLKELWRYRIGDYRVICQIHDDQLIVIALSVGHRRRVYR